MDARVSVERVGDCWYAFAAERVEFEEGPYEVFMREWSGMFYSGECGVKAICCGEEEGVCEILNSCSGIPKRVPRQIIEFNLRAALESSGYAQDEQRVREEVVVEKEDEEKKEESKAMKGKFGKKHLVTVDTADHYEVLGLAHLRWEATDAQIRSAYRKMSLQYHPDKIRAQADEKEVEKMTEIFQRINRAYEVLSDPRERKIYDSQDDDFDNRIPSEMDARTGDFFEVFGIVFDRNSRFSTRRPVPRLGSMEDKYETVEQFYKFWRTFKTWREVKLEEEYDLNEASTREERRWMERKNEKMKNKKKQEELDRIRKLVDLAYKYDPRIKQHENEEKRKRDAAKEAKRLERERIRIEAEQKKEAERRAEQEAKEAAEREVAAKKKAFDDAKSGLMAVLREPATDWCEDVPLTVEFIVNGISETKFVQFVGVVKGLATGPEKKAAVKKAMQQIDAHRKQIREKFEAEERERKLKAQEEEEAKKRRPPWTDDELALLVRAIKKYPPGCRERWRKIADMVMTREEDEIIVKIREMKSKGDAHGVLKSDPFSVTKKTALDLKSEQEIAWDRVNAGNTATTKIVEVEAPKPADPSKWTPEEQKLLEAGLRQFKGKDKWENISKMIPNRTKEDCVARFNFLKEAIAAKKKAAAAGGTK